MYTVEKDDRFHYHFDFWEISKESTEKKNTLKPICIHFTRDMQTHALNCILQFQL